jgi:hypothetical protein
MEGGDLVSCTHRCSTSTWLPSIYTEMIFQVCSESYCIQSLCHIVVFQDLGSFVDYVKDEYPVCKVDIDDR